MTTEQRQMHLSLFINPTGHHQASWRHPRADATAGANFRHYVELALAAERAKFDAVFLADNQAVRTGDPAVISRVAQYVANFEPLTLISALSALTERIGFISTASTSYNFPYQLARKFASIDHISGGRVGWNIVTSGMQQEALNFNRDEHYEHELRYRRAVEFVEVCEGLWNSWEDDAFRRDKETGVFFDPQRLHTLGFDGEFFRVRGPLNVSRSPQGFPVLVQAGSSPTGADFAARFAEMVFVTPQTLEEGRDRYRALKDGVLAHGREPEQVKVMPGLAVIVGRTHEQAEQEFRLLESLLHPDVALNMLSMKISFETKVGGVDLSRYPLEQPLPLHADPDAGGYSFGSWAALGQRENLTLLELARRASGSLAGLSVRGSGEEIADLMEEWFRSGAADGFNIQPAVLPGGLEDFIEFVIPILQRRGLVRTQYAGRTLREHLGLPRPAWHRPGAPRSAPTGHGPVALASVSGREANG